MLRCLLLLCLTVCTSGQTTQPSIPQGGNLTSLVHRSFLNVDMDKDGFIEYYEFDTLIIVADKDNDGCMTKQEYEGFSASTPAIADKIYDRFDPAKSNCLTVNSVTSEFNKMDTDHNNKVTETEFETYYVKERSLSFADTKSGKWILLMDEKENLMRAMRACNKDLLT